MRDPSLYTRLRLDPGQPVFYPMPWVRIVVPAVVDETHEYLTLADGRSAQSFRYLDPINKDSIAINTGKVNDNGWDTFEQSYDMSLLEGSKMHSQFLWIDEPVGHELTIGDDVFLKLSDALSCVPPSRKKHLKRRLSSTRRAYMSFISGTHTNQGYDGPVWPKLPEKKIYVHR